MALRYINPIEFLPQLGLSQEDKSLALGLAQRIEEGTLASEQQMNAIDQIMREIPVVQESEADMQKAAQMRQYVDQSLDRISQRPLWQARSALRGLTRDVLNDAQVLSNRSAALNSYLESLKEAKLSGPVYALAKARGLSTLSGTPIIPGDPYASIPSFGAPSQYVDIAEEAMNYAKAFEDEKFVTLANAVKGMSKEQLQTDPMARALYEYLGRAGIQDVPGMIEKISVEGANQQMLQIGLRERLLSGQAGEYVRYYADLVENTPQGQQMLDRYIAANPERYKTEADREQALEDFVFGNAAQAAMFSQSGKSFDLTLQRLPKSDTDSTGGDVLGTGIEGFMSGVPGQTNSLLGQTPDKDMNRLLRKQARGEEFTPEDIQMQANLDFAMNEIFKGTDERFKVPRVELDGLANILGVDRDQAIAFYKGFAQQTATSERNPIVDAATTRHGIPAQIVPMEGDYWGRDKADAVADSLNIPRLTPEQHKEARRRLRNIDGFLKSNEGLRSFQAQSKLYGANLKDTAKKDIGQNIRDTFGGPDLSTLEAQGLIEVAKEDEKGFKKIAKQRDEQWRFLGVEVLPVGTQGSRLAFRIEATSSDAKDSARFVIRPKVDASLKALADAVEPYSPTMAQRIRMTQISGEGLDITGNWQEAHVVGGSGGKIQKMETHFVRSMFGSPAFSLRYNDGTSERSEVTIGETSKLHESLSLNMNPYIRNENEKIYSMHMLQEAVYDMVLEETEGKLHPAFVGDVTMALLQNNPKVLDNIGMSRNEAQQMWELLKSKPILFTDTTSLKNTAKLLGGMYSS